MKNKVTFVIGGCRSGKSAFALEKANRTKGNKKIFIATSVPRDDEMQKRVDDHQKERGDSWQTIEEPLRIDQAIVNHSHKADVILLDCLTLWVSNLMFASKEEPDIKKEMALLEKALEKSLCPVFLVSNEVGLGIVPENTLARKFRDHAGFVNRKVARIADQVFMTVAGIDIRIKPKKEV